MDKKKIIAIILFILLGLLIFTFANPGPSTLDPVEVPGQSDGDKDTEDDEKIEEPDVDAEYDEDDEETDRPVVEIDNAPIIEINPKTITILLGQNYDVMTGVKASDDNDIVKVTASVIDTTKLEVGTHTITYTTSDRAGYTTTATRTIVVLDPKGDNDEDGYTNEEEIENGNNPDDKEDHPDYNTKPTIDFSACITSMVVYDELPNFEECVKATDEFYGTEGVTIEVTNDVNPNQFGKYTITVVAKDNLENETIGSFEFEVLKRDVTVTINNVEAIYKDEVKPLTSNALEMAYNGNEIGVQLSTEVTNTTPTGKYAITGTWTNENYNVTFVDGVYSITSKTITEEDIKELGIEFNDATFIYDGTEKSLSVNTLPEEFKVSYENNGKVDAGKYEVKAIITGNENYNGEITLTATMTISPKEIRLTWIDRGPFIYNGEKQVFKPQPVEGVEITVDVDGGNGIDVGTYTAVASTTNKNYTLTNNKQEYEIIAKTLKVTWIYRGDYTYDGNEHIPPALVEDGVEITVNVKKGNAIDAGSYTAVAVTSNGNYTLTNSTLDYKILKAQPSYTIPTDLEAEEGQILGDIKLPEGFTFDEDTTKVLDDGEYTTTVTYTPEDTKNYDVVEGIEVTIKVKPVYFTIKFVDKDNVDIFSQTIKKGGNATEPNIAKEYEANGKIYVFNGWEGKYTNVTADATIKPIYLEQNASGTYAYILEAKYIRPVDGEGYPTDHYYNALEDEEGNKVSLTINVSGLTEQQANDIRNGVDPVIVGLGQEQVFKYLAQSTKDALAEISHGVDEGGAYTIEWYVLKYQADGWHLDGHKVYDKTVVTVSKDSWGIFGDKVYINFNNAVTDLKVEVNGEEITAKSNSSNDKVGNEWYVWATNAKTVKVTYTVNGIEYTETFNV